MDEAGSQLLKICKDQVSLDPQHDKVCQKVFKKVLDTVINEAKRVSPDFKEVYYGKYKGGSYFDGLQVKCKNNDFDVNIIFKLPPTIGCTKMHESQNIMGADSQNRLLYPTK